MLRSARTVLLAVATVSFLSLTARAALVNVSAFGDQGWLSDDTRNAGGVNLVGINDTHAGNPGQVPTAADDTAIASQIQFVAGPAGSTYGGAVSMDGTSSNSGKSNYSVIDISSGFATGASLTTFSAQYEWYGQPNPTTRTLAFKLGIQSTNWGTGSGQSQATFTATRSGESAWDLVLVYTPATSDNAWSTVNVDHDSGTWFLFGQAGNTYYTAPGGAVGTDKTLDDWANDATWGPLLFGAGAKVTSIQFGLGSSQKSSIAYLDYLQTNLLNGGDVINFTNVPEPGSFALAAIGFLGLVGGALSRKS
ncbi:MAG TPA: PEP-CTERM sorting domain-containing protein [Pirellulales bacterium]